MVSEGFYCIPLLVKFCTYILSVYTQNFTRKYIVHRTNEMATSPCFGYPSQRHQAKHHKITHTMQFTKYNVVLIICDHGIDHPWKVCCHASWSSICYDILRKGTYILKRLQSRGINLHAGPADVCAFSWVRGTAGAWSWSTTYSHTSNSRSSEKQATSLQQTHSM